MSYLLIDAMNVIGARPTGWWRDRSGATRHFADELSVWASSAAVGEWEGVILVIDGCPLLGMVGDGASIEVVYARGGGGGVAEFNSVGGGDVGPGITVSSGAPGCDGTRCAVVVGGIRVLRMSLSPVEWVPVTGFPSGVGPRGREIRMGCGVYAW